MILNILRKIIYNIPNRTILVVCLIAGSAVHSQLAINSTATNTAVETELQGPNVVIAPGSLTVIYGQPRQYGIFTGGDVPSGVGPIINIDRGVYLATAPGDAFTGSSNEILGPNNTGGISFDAGGGSFGGYIYSDAQLTGISPNAINDPIILNFRATPSFGFLKIGFVFASDEYPDYVCSQYNDAFGFFIKPAALPDIPANWTNLALVPGTATPIAVNTVNNGSPGAFADGTPCDLSNSAFFVDNGAGTTPTLNQNLQYDGFTIPLSVDAPVTPGTLYDIKLAIADAFDHTFDSAVFVKKIASSIYLADADLELDLTVNNSTPNFGDNVVFTVNLTNTGQDAVTGVTADFDLPTGFNFVSSSAGAAYNFTTGIWTVPGSIAQLGGTTSMTVTATAISPGSITAFAEVASMNANDLDSSPANGTPPTPVEDDEDAVTLLVSPPDVSEVCPIADGESTLVESTTAGTVYWDRGGGHPNPGGLILNNDPQLVLSGSAVTFGPGLTGTTDSYRWWLSNVDATNLAQARSLNEYIQISFTTSDAFTYVDKWFSWYGTQGANGYLPFVGMDFATQADFSDAVNFYDGLGVSSSIPKWNILIGKGALLLHPNTTYYVRVFPYGMVGLTRALDAIGLDIGSCSDMGDAPFGGLAAHGQENQSHYLGTGTPDTERNLQNATNGGTDGAGDDLDGTDDENGVTIPATMFLGRTANIPVSVIGAGGYLQAWFDWNQDGDFLDPGEMIANDLQDGGGLDTDPTTGIIGLTVFVPANATTGPTYARFRWSSANGLGISNVAPDGEAEDYQALLKVATVITNRRITYRINKN